MANRGNPKSKTIHQIHATSWYPKIDREKWDCLPKRLPIKKRESDKDIALLNFADSAISMMKREVDEIRATRDEKPYTRTLASAKKKLEKLEKALNELYAEKYRPIFEDYGQMAALDTAMDQLTDIRRALLEPMMSPKIRAQKATKENLVRASVVQDLKRIFQMYDLPTDLTKSGKLTSFGKFLKETIYDMLGEAFHSDEALIKKMRRDLKSDVREDS